MAFVLSVAPGAQRRVDARAEAATVGDFGKVPEVTIGFWLIKIAATTLGETGGDAVTMGLHLGYLLGTLVFATLFALLVAMQIRARRFHPFLFWGVIVATTTVGTTLADFADRSLGIGYTGGASILAVALIGSLVLWQRSCGSIAVARVTTPKAEAFYWITILLSQTLGTALGDFVADVGIGFGGLGFGGGALVFGAALILVVALYLATDLSRVALFWAAFILTRPLGATVGDFLDKPLSAGGLDLSRAAASLVLAAFIVAAILIFPQRPERIVR